MPLLARQRSRGSPAAQKAKSKTVSDYLDQATADLQDLYHATDAFLIALGDDVTKKVGQLYLAYRRFQNFACVEVHPQSKKLLVYLKVDLAGVDLKSGFTRDVHSIGHFGTGDLEVTLTSLDDLERVIDQQLRKQLSAPTSSVAVLLGTHLSRLVSTIRISERRGLRTAPADFDRRREGGPEEDQRKVQK